LAILFSCRTTRLVHAIYPVNHILSLINVIHVC
jgi:hypothetical protein